MERHRRIAGIAIVAAVLVAGTAPPARAASFLTGSLADASNFAVLYEGNGNNQLSTTNVTVNGNIGIGDPSGSTTAFLNASGPGTLNGNVEYAGAVSSNQSVSNTTVTGTITGGNTNVQTDLTNLNTLSSTLGTATGTALTINTGGSGGSQTVNASSGTAILSGPNAGDLVFSVGSMQFNNQTTLTINGNGGSGPSSQLVVFNMPFGAQFGGNIVLTGGLTSDQVLFNVTGGSGLTGGNTDQLNNNGAASLQGIFLDPNGAVSVVHTVLTGRVFGGDTSNMQIVSGDTITAPPGTTKVPEPNSILLLLGALAGFGVYRSRRIRLKAAEASR